MTAIIILTLLIVLFLFLVFPSSIKGKSFFDNYKFIAHRGLHSDIIPENSLSSFSEAIKYNYAIENDIHITKDDQVVVFHDDTLLRMCGVDKKIEECTLNELNKLTLKNTSEKIPTLKECLDLVNGQVPLLIEFKCLDKNTCEKLCVKANEILKEYKGEYAIQSFYPFVLNWYKKYRPDVLRGQLASAFNKENISKKLLGAMMFNFIARPQFISYEHFHKNNIFLKICLFLGAYPVAWTYKEQKHIDETKDTFNNYIFEKFIPEQKG